MIGQPNPACRLTALVAFALVAFAAVGCGTAEQSPGTVSPPKPISSADPGQLEARLSAVDRAVSRWRSATDLATAR